MPRTAFERQLAEIQEDMLVLATMVESAIDQGIEALRNRDVHLARHVIADDLRINRKRYQTEEKCLELIATQQPLASDRRTIVSVLHIIVDLERMGDHAEGIAKIAIMLADELPLKPYIDIPGMAQVAISMLMAAWRPSRTTTQRNSTSRSTEVGPAQPAASASREGIRQSPLGAYSEDWATHTWRVSIAVPGRTQTRDPQHGRTLLLTFSATMPECGLLSNVRVPRGARTPPKSARRAAVERAFL